MQLLIWAAVVSCACAFDLDTQAVQSVKGGLYNFQYQGGDITRFFNNGSSHTSGHGQVPAVNFEVGVCYIEVPTATLVRDPAHVPTGNGSRSDLSRIRTCCKGYARNVYNFKICEPVCSQGCVNALCTAPETCTCFPDHVRNSAGFCVATCPIGCQNGHCAGGECLCKEGYKLDIDGRYCLPNCRGNCGGLGNCTAPNTCECKPGYRSTPDGSCQPADRCSNGDYVSGECRCHGGYHKDSQGNCVPHCNQNCGPNGKCLAPNVCSMAPDLERFPPNQRPQNPSYYNQNPNNNPQNPANSPDQNTFSYSPNRPNYPYPTNQNGSHPLNQEPQPNPSYPFYQGSQYPDPQNGSNVGQGFQPNPSYPSNQGYSPQYPYPQNSSNPQHNISVGHHYPLTPGSQIGQNPYNQPQYPYNSDGQTPSTQMSNPQHPSVQVINVTYPYPMYPGNQLGSNGPGTPYQPGQNPYSQRPNTYQGSGYPTPQHAYYPSNEPSNYPSQQGGSYPNGYPSYQQYPFDQTQESSLCSEPCVNAVCIDHNRCRCNPGYITDENYPSGNRCRPHCPGGCLNGYCAAPHSCACDEGYYRDTSVKGRAVCVKRIRRNVPSVELS